MLNHGHTYQTALASSETNRPGRSRMLARRLPFMIGLIALLFSHAVVHAQTTASAVTAAVTGGDTVRVTAPGEVSQIQLEVYGANGEVIFDSGVAAGNVIDWKATDAYGAIGQGSVLIVVTTRNVDNQASQKYGSLTLETGQLTLKQNGAPTATQKEMLKARRQSQNIEALENLGPLTIVSDANSPSMVVTTHNGQEGQVSSTRGALTLSTGDTLTGKDKPQVTVMPNGRVGVGTQTPEATLDVNGEIRARGGIRFSDGSLLTSASGTTGNGAKQTFVTGAPTTNIAGTGTTNQLSKWIDNAGTLGNSGVTEDANGNVGIGTTNPLSKLHLSGPGGATAMTLDTPGSHKFRFQTVPNVPNWGAFTLNANYNNGWQLDDTTVNGWFFKLDTRGGNAASDNNGLWLWRVPNGSNPHTNEYPVFGVTNGRVFFAENVGINTNAPTQKLEVAGNIKIGGAGNGLMFPDGSVMTSATAGGSPSGTSVIAAINDPATVGTINDNRLSPNVARLSAQNFFSGQNTFSGLSMNNTNIVNLANPVSATDAVNKSYVDGGFVKFVPATEQLSVGDANGTAPMINLRGGSTCCSGPGGHTPAWFKVFQNGSFVATGNLGIGVSPMQGKGYRTSWDSDKGAFRSGYADAEWDDANVGFFSWAGGSNSTALGLYSLAFGDTNSAESTSSIVFGSGNQVKGAAGFSAGAGNRVCDTYGVALGNNAKSGGPYINGKCDPDSFNLRGLAAVAIGYNVTADQDHTTAMGKFASNNGFFGTFVWSDGSATQTADTFRNTANNEFALRATGGFRFRTNLAGTTGCNLPAGSGVFNCTSSRYTKENFSLVNGNDVLSRLRNVPISTWNYISEGRGVRHMGPMAEDFFQAFKLGTNNTSIGVQDLAGVSLGAIQELDQRTTELQQKAAEVDQLRQRVDELRLANQALEKRLSALEQQAAKPAPRAPRRK